MDLVCLHLKLTVLELLVLTCLIGVGASKEHAEAVMLVPVAAHALLKHIRLHNEVWQGGITGDGQGQGPLGLPLLSRAGACRAQQQPGHWPPGLLSCQNCLFIFW